MNGHSPTQVRLAQEKEFFEVVSASVDEWEKDKLDWAAASREIDGFRINYQLGADMNFIKDLAHIARDSNSPIGDRKNHWRQLLLQFDRYNQGIRTNSYWYVMAIYEKQNKKLFSRSGSAGTYSIKIVIHDQSLSFDSGAKQLALYFQGAVVLSPKMNDEEQSHNILASLPEQIKNYKLVQKTLGQAFVDDQGPTLDRRYFKHNFDTLKNRKALLI